MTLAAYLAPSGGWWLSRALVWPWLFSYRSGFRAYREWTLEQFKSATTYLLGSDEPVLAAEVGLYSEILIGNVWGGNAVVVTARHVLVLSNDSPLGRPRRGLLLGHPKPAGLRQHGGGVFHSPPTHPARAR